jgi:hypothetical protein
VFTWWEGYEDVFDVRHYLIFDSSYSAIAWVRAGNGHRGDLH